MIYMNMELSLAQSVLLGCVEGLTEFLPVSSTAHLIMISQLLGVEQTAFMKSFEIIIQLGSILAVVALYWRSFLEWEVIKRLAVAFMPTAIIGLVLYKVVKTVFMESYGLIVAMLLLGGIALILFERWHTEKDDARAEISTMPYTTCMLIGVCQSLAMVPGVSRSAATVVGGLLLGMRRAAIVQFSFLLAVPTMAAATGLDVVKNAAMFSAEQTSVLAVGFVTAFVMAIVAMRSFLAYVKKHSFTAFGVYRIVIAVIFGSLLLW